jgi:phosphohistidine phosphatase
VETREDPRLYEASKDGLLKVIHEVEPGIRTLLMIGHNPAVGELARLLVGHGDRYAFARLSRAFPTCAFAVIDFAAESWDRVEPRGGRLDRFVTPATLGGSEDD